MGIPFAITPLGQLYQSPPSPIPGDLFAASLYCVSGDQASETWDIDRDSLQCLVAAKIGLSQLNPIFLKNQIEPAQSGFPPTPKLS